MPRCKHCNGTGEAPIKLRQECVGCQRPLTVTFSSLDELAENNGLTYCKDCKPVDKQEDLS